MSENVFIQILFFSYLHHWSQVSDIVSLSLHQLQKYITERKNTEIDECNAQLWMNIRNAPYKHTNEDKHHLLSGFKQLLFIKTPTGLITHCLLLRKPDLRSSTSSMGEEEERRELSEGLREGELLSPCSTNRELGRSSSDWIKELRGRKICSTYLSLSKWSVIYVAASLHEYTGDNRQSAVPICWNRGQLG